MGSVSGRFELMRQVILVDENPISHVQNVWKPGFVQDPSQQSNWPDSVIYLGSIFVEDQAVLSPHSIHLAGTSWWLCSGLRDG